MGQTFMRNTEIEDGMRIVKLDQSASKAFEEQ